MAAISARASAAALAHAEDFAPWGLPCGVVTGDCEAGVLLPETAPIPGDGGWAACGMCRGDAGGVFAGDRDRDRGGRPGIELVACVRVTATSSTITCIVRGLRLPPVRGTVCGFRR